MFRGVAGLNIGFDQKVEPRLVLVLLTRPGFYEVPVLAFGDSSKELNLVRSGRIVRERQQESGIGVLNGLMHLEGRSLGISLIYYDAREFEKHTGGRKTIIEILLRRLIRLLWRRGLGSVSGSSSSS